MILPRHIAIVLLWGGIFALCGCDRKLREARKTAEATGNSEMYQVAEIYAGDPDTTHRVAVDLTPLIRKEDRDTFQPADYYIAYWDRDRWQPTGQPVVETAGIAADGSAERLYSVSGLPNRAIYGIFRKDNGRTYYRRIFRAWNTIPTRF